MLVAPTELDKRCRLADWLELTALFSHRRLASSGDLRNVFDIATDGREDRDTRDTTTGELLDQEILDEPRSAVIERAFTELEFRAKCLGASHPFTVDADREIVQTAFQEATPHFGQVAYTFCLLASAIRTKLLTLASLEQELQELPSHFQVCACLAAGGYFGGAVTSFGFPRSEGTAFLPALKAAYDKFGNGVVRPVIEPGMPAATKDGGVDVIAWRDHPDRLPSKLYSLGQCASGLNWVDKPVTPDTFHGDWFSDWPARHCMPALYIPFLVHDSLDEFEEDDTYLSARMRHISRHERNFGIIFDRLRIAHHTQTLMTAGEERHTTVDGVPAALSIANWVNRTVAKVLAAQSVTA